MFFDQYVDIKARVCFDIDGPSPLVATSRATRNRYAYYTSPFCGNNDSCNILIIQSIIIIS
jgi:hypothetical protein